MATRPTSWPTNGDYTGIRDWLWWGDVDFPGVMGYRGYYNAGRIAAGLPAIATNDENAWAVAKLPLPQIATSYADAQSHGGRIHPLGIDMDSLHEYEGEARAVAFERNRLTVLALPYAFRFVWEVLREGIEPPTPPLYDEWRRSNYAYLTDYARALEAAYQPQPPTEGGSTMPQNPIDPNTGLPVGTPPPPSSGSTGLPPGTPDPSSPPLSEYTITNEFTGRVTGAAVPVQFEDVTLFRLPATGKIEVVVKRADVPKPNFFIASMTDVGFTVTVTRKSDGQQRSYTRPEGKGVEALLYFD